MDVRLDARDRALLDLGMCLREAGYAFTTVSPETHRRVYARPGNLRATNLRDVFGWSRPFTPGLLPTRMLANLEAADALVMHADHLRTTVRFSSLGGQLYVHSAYPTVEADAVFFGPDSYRFCALLDREVVAAKRCIDVGCGSGVGGLSLANRVDQIVLADINASALRFARINAHLAGVADRVQIVEGDLYERVAGDVDLIVANPPYLVDESHRIYRDGGGELGEGIAVRIVREGIGRLAKGGRLVLYTGAPIVHGIDYVRRSIAPVLEASGARWSYNELDPDVFGEELDVPAYAAVERIAAVAAVVTVA
jgi:SAM-dependent methyltransferase